MPGNQKQKKTRAQLKRGKKRGSQVAPPLCGDWLVVGGCIGELEQEAERLKTSKKRADTALSRKVWF